jgi:hypothetical protein
MRSEKKFKERISEIASRIAEEDAAGSEPENPNKPKSDGDKASRTIAKISSLESPLSQIDQASEFTDLLRGLMDLMPSLTRQKAVQGMNTLIKDLANISADNSDPSVSKDDKNAMFDKMPVPAGVSSDSDLPSLKEAFNRINRK